MRTETVYVQHINRHRAIARAIIVDLLLDELSGKRIKVRGILLAG